MAAIASLKSETRHASDSGHIAAAVLRRLTGPDPPRPGQAWVAQAEAHTRRWGGAPCEEAVAQALRQGSAGAGLGRGWGGLVGAEEPGEMVGTGDRGRARRHKLVLV